MRWENRKKNESASNIIKHQNISGRCENHEWDNMIAVQCPGTKLPQSLVAIVVEKTRTLWFSHFSNAMTIPGLTAMKYCTSKEINDKISIVKESSNKCKGFVWKFWNSRPGFCFFIEVRNLGWHAIKQCNGRRPAKHAGSCRYCKYRHWNPGQVNSCTQLTERQPSLKVLNDADFRFSKQTVSMIVWPIV